MEKLKDFVFNNTIFRNVIAVLIGLLVGAFSNMGIIILGMKVLPLPEGVDINRIETIIANIDKYTFPHFINVFLAHGIGTLLGAFTCVKLAKSRHLGLAMIVGFCFLYGGYDMVKQIPAPMTFNIIDLVGAYIPMAWLGYFLANKKPSTN
jgi:hypothetical protein